MFGTEQTLHCTNTRINIVPFINPVDGCILWYLFRFWEGEGGELLGGDRIKTSYCMHFENLLVEKNKNSLISGGLVFTV